MKPIKTNMDARTQPNEQSQQQREAIRQAIAFKQYEFDAHGVEMNQRYHSCAIEADGQVEPAFARDAELHYQATTFPGARLPHVWLFNATDGSKHSTLDLCGQGKFTLFTGIGGEPWVATLNELVKQLGIQAHSHIIGPRQQYVDHLGDWARICEISDTGCLLVRPDHHVAWRSSQGVDNYAQELTRVFKQILDIQ